MKAYAYDDDGFFVGEIECQPSPLEQDVWLLPGSSAKDAAPTPGEDQEARWDGKEWQLVKSRALVAKEKEAEEAANQPELPPLREQDPDLQPVLTAQQLGAEVVAKVYRINERKKFDADTLLDLMDDPLFSKIERLCWGGALKTARDLVPSLSDKFYSDEDKAEVIDMISGFLK